MNSDSLVQEFIYGCSHDLRSPLSSIQGLVRIAGYYPHNCEVHKCLEMIEDCTTKMDTLLRKLQEYLSDSLQPLNIQVVDIHETIDIIRDEFRNQTTLCNIDILEEVKASSDWIVDRSVMIKILKNLVSNSIAYHDPDKAQRRILIKIESDIRGSWIDVSDNGLGIQEDQQRKIFNIFSRATEQSIGTGMGLFLVKSLVDKLSGSVSCHSSFGDGTRIRIWFPNLFPGSQETICEGS